ncbi:MAG: S-layer homology domain-containing protein, partial [Anaerotignaceae bacterium]
MKKGLTIFFATLFTFAATAPTMAAVTFSDFNNVPWDSAKDYITTVADLGLMVGQENNDGTSSFRAKDPVTYNETVQLVFNLLKNEGKATASAATTTKWTQTMQSNNIPTWAYDAVAYCLENGIVTSKELTTFMANSGTANNATREDVAVFFGKALSIDHRISEDPTLTFTDKNSVSLSAAPYVELLARLEILVGDEYGNFNPKKEINRAEMAVVTTKTYNNISDESVTVKRKTVEGTIYEVKTNGSQIGLMLNNSNSYFYGTKDTKTSYQNYDYNFSNLVVGDKVSIEYIGSSIIAVELISTASSEKSVSGTLNNITTKRVIVDKLDQSTNGYNLASNVEIFLNEKAANVGKITKLLENGVTSTVIVTLNQSGEAATISVTGKENLVEGHINNISSSEITIKRNVSTEKAYTISKYATATFEGKVSTVSHVIDAMRTYGSIYVVAEIDDNLTV